MNEWELPPLCQFCRRYVNQDSVPLDEKFRERCTVFPDGIPQSVFEMDQVHTKRVKGDRGVIFAPKADIPQQIVEAYELQKFMKRS